MKAMLKKLGAVTFLLFCLGSAAHSARGQNSVINGHVFANERSPISQLPVELLNDFNRVLQRTKTDGGGRFVFNRVPAGRVSVRVVTVGTGLEEQTQEVEIASIGISGRLLSDNIQLDFYLRPRSNSGTNLAAATIFAQDIPVAAEKMYADAVRNFDQKKLDLAIESLENALKLFPDYYLALEKLGLFLSLQQKYDGARIIFEKAVAVNERSFNSWYGLSYANYSLKRPEAAVIAAEKAISHNSESADAHLLMGVSLRSAKKYSEAEKSLRRAEKASKGKSADVHWNLALLYAYNLKRFKDAANELESFLNVNPKNPDRNAITKLIKKFRDDPGPLD